jgi:hypothetical protein
MKAEHLKAQADDAVQQGNYGVAIKKCVADSPVNAVGWTRQRADSEEP